MVDSDHIDVMVLGAGVIGTFAALELRKSGKSVTLIDRQLPGSATSLGNAGVLNRGSIIPLNNPMLLRQLPSLLTGNKTGFDYKLSYVFDEMSWGLRFLSHCNAADTLSRAVALNDLISRSAELYKQSLPPEMFNEGGWLKIYRGKLPSENSIEMIALNENDVRYEVLDSYGIQELEPSISSERLNALWIKDTMALRDPQHTVITVARNFEQLGGEFIRSEVRKLIREGGKWSVILAAGKEITADHVVVAFGPWSKDFLEQVNIFVPMAFERGAHREFEEGIVPLTRPIHDTDAGYVISPLEKRWRVTCGVELALIDAPRSSKQMDDACMAMKTLLSPGAQIDKPDWLGSRPTLPDSLPAIGATQQPNLWISTGHQHIGMASAPASGELISDLINGRETKLNAEPFSPARCNI